jgi:DNA-binding XRE family transcriptional regulator
LTWAEGGRLDPELEQIAQRVRRFRTDEGLTLQDLGERAGVSASTIHKIENGQTVPTISVLLKVANGLRRPPAELFEGAAQTAVVRHVRASDGIKFEMISGSRVDRITGGIPRARIDLWRVQHAPGAGAGLDEPLRYDGELVILLERGALEVEVDGQRFALSPGDTLHFKTHHPHRWRNVGEAQMSALFFGTLTSGFGERGTS